MGVDSSRLPQCACKSRLEFKREDESLPITQPTINRGIPLNARQVFRLKASWKGIRREIGATGLKMFIRYALSNNLVKCTPEILLPVAFLMSRYQNKREF